MAHQRRSLAHLCLAASCALIGTGAGASPISVAINGWTVTADAATGAWSVTPAGMTAPVLSGPGTCDASGFGTSAARVGWGAPRVENAFGAFRIRLEGQGALEWSSVCGSFPRIAAGPATLAMTWTARPPSGPAVDVTVSFSGSGQRDLGIALSSSAPGVTAGEIAMSCSPSDAFFGLGTQAVGMDLRGHIYPLWTQEQGIGKPPGGGYFPLQNVPEAAYAPMGIWHSSAGYTAVLATDTYAELDLAGRAPNRVVLRSFRDLPGLVLVAGDTLRDRIANLDRFVGRVTPPPAWVFGPWNDAVGGPSRLWTVASTLRANHIPSSAIWSEDWAGGDQGPYGYRLSYAWEWDPATYPNLPGDVIALHDEGFAFLTYFNSFVPKPTRMWHEGVTGGFLIRDTTGAPYTFLDPALRDASMVDLTNPAAVAWLESYLETAASTLSIDGWMADFGEWLPVDCVLDGGQDPWRAHNLFPLQWQDVNRRVLAGVHLPPGGGPPDDWTFFARSGWASTNGGAISLAPLLWGGDQNTDWGYDDGFPTVAPIATHAGLCGVAIFGSDIAGYTSIVCPPTTKELFLRWAALGAFHPLMRTHHGSNQSANWSFDRDADTLARYKRFAIVHTLLYPYLQALVADAVLKGLPMTRHPFLVEPARPGLYRTADYELFLGDDILIAPVIKKAARSRDVRLPAAGWWPLWGDAPIVTGQPGPGNTWAVSVPAPLGEIPAFARPGTILPLLADPVDSFHSAGAPGITSLRDVAGRFRLALYPDAGGTLRPADVGAAVVSGQGFTAMPFDWSGSLLDGQPLPDCSQTIGQNRSCASSDHVRLVGSTLTLSKGGATLTIASPSVQEYTIGIAGAAWRPWGLP
ncbi:MAG: glycoside hydrolase family 31 protein [Acidobacteriota bacterium]